MLVPKVRHRENSSPANRRHNLLWQSFFEGILAVLSVEFNSSNGDLSLTYLDQTVSRGTQESIDIPPDQLLGGLIPADTTHICSAEPPGQNSSQERQSYSLPAKLARDRQTKEDTPK